MKKIYSNKTLVLDRKERKFSFNYFFSFRRESLEISKEKQIYSKLRKNSSFQLIIILKTIIGVVPYSTRKICFVVSYIFLCQSDTFITRYFNCLFCTILFRVSFFVMFSTLSIHCNLNENASNILGPCL